MKIHDNTWTTGEMVTSVKLENMYLNEVNVTDNIHPQYLKSVIDPRYGIFYIVGSDSTPASSITSGPPAEITVGTAGTFNDEPALIAAFERGIETSVDIQANMKRHLTGGGTGSALYKLFKIHDGASTLIATGNAQTPTDNGNYHWTTFGTAVDISSIPAGDLIVVQLRVTMAAAGEDLTAEIDLQYLKVTRNV
jgi:hypothetical protein